MGPASQVDDGASDWPSVAQSIVQRARSSTNGTVGVTGPEAGGRECLFFGHHILQSMDQTCKVVNPARGQLNREN